MQRFNILRLILIVPAILLFSASGLRAQDSPLQVIATTTLIADVARNVGGDLVEVTSLVPADSDVHAFEPAPTDAARLSDADIVLVNGAGLETFLGGLLENAATTAPVVVSNGVPMLAFGTHDHDITDHDAEAHESTEIIGVLGVDGLCDVHQEADHDEVHTEGEDEHEHGACDPHVWMNPQNIIIWADNIAAAFAAADPANAEVYAANAQAYQEDLAALDAELLARIDTLPAERRILVTNHDFMGYFAAHYGFEIVGTVITGGSTLSEPDPQSLAALVDLVQAEGVPAIFAEISANSQLAAVIAAETGATVVMTIYSEALSNADGPASTYLDYMRYNVETIVNALST